MSAAPSFASAFDRNPQPWVRASGGVYLAIIAFGLLGEAVARASAQPGTVLASVAAHETLWRWGIAGDLLMHALDVPCIVVMYLLLRPFSPPLALMATVFNIVQTAVLALSKLTLTVPLLLPGLGLPEASAEALAALALRLHSHGFGIGLVFFGFACLLRGHLLRRTALVPPVLGWMLQLAGLCYLVNSFVLLLHRPLAGLLFPWVLMPAFVGELALALWTLVRGIDLVRWQARPGAA